MQRRKKMACTTILVGRKASYDGSTMIARTDDGMFDVKKTVVLDPAKQKRTYKSVISHREIELPENPLRCTISPDVNPSKGIWAASGINEANVGMTATETITSNPRVYGADPLVEYKAKTRTAAEQPGGFGEEDFVVLVLPYIRTAREGVIRLGALLEEYGTYEANGIAFNDADEIWWLETIGGHHWMARRVGDEEYVNMPNQLGIDRFDFADAFGKKKNYMCSADLKEFVEVNHLDLNQGTEFNPRYAFGSRTDSDHVYNTPRAWFMCRYFNPNTYKWDGPDADFNPESDDIPWAMVPEKKITPEDIKYILSSYYQGTPYNPYQKADDPHKGIYRPIGISRTGVTTICQIRGYLPETVRGIEWISYGSNAFNTMLPIYTGVSRLPAYISDVKMDVSSENFYWASRLIDVLADAHYGESIQTVERYQNQTVSKARQILNEYDQKIMESGNAKLCEEANRKLCSMLKAETGKTMNAIMHICSLKMKNGYSRADN